MPIFFIQIVSSLGFSVLYSTLVLYMEDKLGMPTQVANSVTGIFIAFNYALHVLGGFWGGRFFSNRTLFCIGMMAQFVGSLLLSVGDSELLYPGLAVFLTGSGINVTCLNCILIQRFSPDDHRRETAFLWNYSGMSLGFLIGYTLSGFYQVSHNYQDLFVMSSLGSIISIVICFLCWRHLADLNTHYSTLRTSQKLKASLLGALCVFLLPIILYELLQHAAWSNQLVLTSGVFMLAFCCYIAWQEKQSAARNKMIALIIFMIVSMIFWMLYQIGPMGLTLFTEHNVNRTYFGGTIPPQWFGNISTLCIIAGGPLLAMVLNALRRRGVQVNLASQFSLALLCIGIAFVLLPLGIMNANHEGLISPTWLITCYVFQSVGEMLISPIGYSMIGSLAPVRYQSLMMGVLMLYCGVGATLSSYSSNLMIIGQETSLALATNPGYSRVFLILGLFAIGCAVMLGILVTKLKLMLQPPPDADPI